MYSHQDGSPCTISMREHFIISTKIISNFFHLPYFQSLSATFQFLSLQRLSVTFLLQLGGYVLPQAIDRHPLIKRRIVLSSYSKKSRRFLIYLLKFGDAVQAVFLPFCLCFALLTLLIISKSTDFLWGDDYVSREPDVVWQRFLEGIMS